MKALVLVPGTKPGIKKGELIARDRSKDRAREEAAVVAE